MDQADTNGVFGMIRKIVLDDPSELILLKQKLEDGSIISGQTTLIHGPGAAFDDRTIHIPPGIIKSGQFGRRDNDHRRLATLTGTKPILVVRVTDGDGQVIADSPYQMSDNVFGTYGDPNNLKSQLTACSHGVLNVEAGAISPETAKADEGVIEVTVNTRLAVDNRYVMHDAVTAAVQEKLGIILPGPYQQVMYVMKNCQVGCGYAAYAYVGHWLSVYQDVYYAMTGVQVHELGHNFGMAHSGGTDGQPYTDHTGMMGNPLYSDDVGRMCYNGAKNYMLAPDWYPNGGSIDLSTNNGPNRFDPQLITLIGMSEYGLAEHPVTVKLETGTDDDYFVAFNRANGANSDNDLADDEVTITLTGNNGISYSQSWLQATLIEGESHSITNFAGTGQDLTIQAVSIDISTTPALAKVCISYGGAACEPEASPEPTTVPPTNTPTTSAPINSPSTPFPTNAPTTPFPTNPPTTPFPTNPPTTPFPSTSPTSEPTDSPTICSLQKENESCKFGSDCCSGLCSGGQQSSRVCLTNTPTTPSPTPSQQFTPEPTDSGPSCTLTPKNGDCSANDECCSGNCKPNGRCS